MRLLWLASLCVVAIAMAALTPYLFGNEPMWWAIGWSCMLVCAVGSIVVLIRIEKLLHTHDRSTGDRVSTR